MSTPFSSNLFINSIYNAPAIFALSIAYVFFLSLLWLWLRYKTEDYADLIDFAPNQHNDQSISLSDTDGGFGGGGASDSFDDGNRDASISESIDSVDISNKSHFSLDFDEFAILVIFALAMGLAFASLYIVYLTPALFAELILDGILSYTLYRRLRGVNTEHWLMTAFCRTVMPFVLTAIFLFIIGLTMSIYVPGARSIADVLSG